MIVRCISLVCALIVSSVFVFWVHSDANSAAQEQITRNRTWDEAITMAKSFVAQLTLEEKCNMTAGVRGECAGNVLPIPRLNFIGMCLQGAPAGRKDGVQFATAFPPGIHTAATWDRDLFFRRAVAIGEEFRGRGIHYNLGPTMNMNRNARYGRNWEGFGADPYLSGENAFYYVQGLQDQGVIASAKHYICNEQETQRSVNAPPFKNATAYSVNLDDKTIHEIYLWPFASSVAAGVGSVMCSYNRVNGTPACQNKRILIELLKEELEFTGNVMSDWWAIRTSIESVLGGLDTDMGGGDEFFGMTLLSAVYNGTIPIARIDDMIIRLLAPYYLLGQDIGYPTLDLSRDVLGDHHQINREISRAGIILLKNTNNALPFNVTTDKNFVVYGEAASRSKYGFSAAGVLQLGGAIYQGGGSSYVEPTYAIDPLTSLLLKGRESHLRIRYIANQCGDVINASLDFLGHNASLNFPDNASTKCLVFISSYSTEGLDRIDLHAADNGDSLVRTVAARCPHTIVIVNSVSQLDLEAWIDHPNIVAVIWSGMPGTEYGSALVDVLFGDYNPGGKLVFTLAKREADYGTNISLSGISDYDEGVFLDYRHFDQNNIEPRFYFGFGLSYTTFAFSQLDISKTRKGSHTASALYQQRRNRSYARHDTHKLDEPVYEIAFTVMNTGQVNGSEVPQAYLGFPAEAEQPPKVLRGFERVYLAPGEIKEVILILTQKDISYWNVANQHWAIATGNYVVWISTSASRADIKLHGSFNI